MKYGAILLSNVVSAEPMALAVAAELGPVLRSVDRIVRFVLFVGETGELPYYDRPVGRIMVTLRVEVAELEDTRPCRRSRLPAQR